MAKQSLYVLNRDFVLSTLVGYSIQFKKDVPTHVPYLIVSDALAIGALPYEGTELPTTEENPRKTVDPAERQELILAALEDLMVSNNREDFTATGMPTVKAVERELGFDVQAKEIAAAKAVYDAKKAAQ